MSDDIQRVHQAVADAQRVVAEAAPGVHQAVADAQRVVAEAAPGVHQAVANAQRVVAEAAPGVHQAVANAQRVVAEVAPMFQTILREEAKLRHVLREVAKPASPTDHLTRLHSYLPPRAHHRERQSPHAAEISYERPTAAYRLFPVAA